MTVVAFDSKIIAVDSKASIRGTGYTIKKWREGSYFNRKFLMFCTGTLTEGMDLMDWYDRTAGASKEKYPEPSNKEYPARLVVANTDGVFWYEGSWQKITTTGEYMAFGSGMDLALGALAHGANAIEAVAVACKHEEGCGGPIIAFNYRTGERIQ